MNKDIGFVLIRLTNDDIYNQILQTIKKFENNNLYGQTLIFNSINERIDTYNLPILHLSQSQFFDGVLFIFDLPGIIMSREFPNLTKRILYASNMPWHNHPQTRFEEWESLYAQDSLDIITSNQTLYDIYKICWKEPLGISENFNYEELSQLI